MKAIDHTRWRRGPVEEYMALVTALGVMNDRLRQEDEYERVDFHELAAEVAILALHLDLCSQRLGGCGKGWAYPHAIKPRGRGSLAAYICPECRSGWTRNII